MLEYIQTYKEKNMDYRSFDFASEIEARVAVKTFVKWARVVVGFVLATYVLYLSITNPDAIISFFERVLTY